MNADNSPKIARILSETKKRLNLPLPIRIPPKIVFQPTIRISPKQNLNSNHQDLSEINEELENVSVKAFIGEKSLSKPQNQSNIFNVVKTNSKKQTLPHFHPPVFSAVKLKKEQNQRSFPQMKEKTKQTWIKSIFCCFKNHLKYKDENPTILKKLSENIQQNPDNINNEKSKSDDHQSNLEMVQFSYLNHNRFQCSSNESESSSKHSSSFDNNLGNSGFLNQDQIIKKSTVCNNGMCQIDIDKIILIPFDSTKHYDEHELDKKECAICFVPFKVGDQLRLLYCLHRYHKKCVDEWLGKKSCCPNCQFNYRSINYNIF